MTTNTRTLIGSGSRTEDLAAYSRAVVDGDWVLVSGTIGLDPVTGSQEGILTSVGSENLTANTLPPLFMP